MATRMLRRSVGIRVATKLVDEAAMRLADQTEQAIDLIVRTRGPSIAAAVEIEQLRNPHLTPRDLAQRLTQERMRVVAASGAISALPGVVPGAGSTAEIAAAVADAGWLVYNEIVLVLSIAHAYGRDLREEDARRMDVLLALAYEAGVAVPVGKTIEVLGERIAMGAIPRDTIASVNRRIGGSVVKKVARRRVKVILGREIPLGIGVAIGAGFNYTVMRRVGRAAVKYFEL